MRTVVPAAILAVAACSSQGSPPSTASVGESSTRLDQFTCADTAPGAWDDGFVPQQRGRFSAVFALASDGPSAAPIDAVAGFGNGPAGAFTDLGPIVRLAPDGFVDARNGGAYQRDAALDYTLYDYDPYVWIRMDVDVPSHTYSVWANHDGRDDTVQIANGYAFRTEQAGLARLDTIGRDVDSATGTLRFCDVETSPPVCTRSGAHQTWASTAFPAQTGAFRLEIDVTPLAPKLDAVVGLAAAAPAAFRDLGAIFRFNSNGTMDARDGDVYRADVVKAYQDGGNYRVAFDVDLATHTYSVSVRGPGLGAAPVAIATGYHFRTEQAGVASLASLGQYVDDDSADYDGALEACDLTAMD